MAWYLIQLHPPRERFAETITPDEQAVVGRHFQYLQHLQQQGKLFLAGRCEDASLGIALVQAEDDAEAETLLREDPAVSGGVFAATIRPWRLALYQSFPETYNAN